MKTLLELRDEETQNWVNHCDGTDYKPKMFIAMGDLDGRLLIFNGWFIDPCMNLIESKNAPGKCAYFSDVQLSKIKGSFVDNKD